MPDTDQWASCPDYRGPATGTAFLVHYIAVCGNCGQPVFQQPTGEWTHE